MLQVSNRFLTIKEVWLLSLNLQWSGGFYIYYIVFLDQKISCSTVWNLQFFMTVINAAPQVIHKHILCCFVAAQNLDDITHTLQTFHWFLPVNIHPFGEWWDIFQPTFIEFYRMHHLKTDKVPWGAMELVMIWMHYFFLCTVGPHFVCATEAACTQLKHVR